MGIVACVLFAVATILYGTGAHTNNAWFTPGTLIAAGLCFLALHLSGINWTRKP